jgi:Bacterial trigger factor protein (TF)
MPFVQSCNHTLLNATSIARVAQAAGISRYSFDIAVQPQVTQKIYNSISKELRSKANFPGFRKGVIPPFALSQVCISLIITHCVVQ